MASENPEHSCRVYCAGKNGKAVTKSWTFPDGTICRNQNSDIDDNYYCVNGRCEVWSRINYHLEFRVFLIVDIFQKFTCDNSTSNSFLMDTTYCTQIAINAKLTKNLTSSEVIDSGRDIKNIEKMRPSAASLVQRYTRNGEYFFLFWQNLHSVYKWNSSFACK